MNGFNLINVISTSNNEELGVEDGAIVYMPGVFYRVEIDDPFNPLNKIREGKYYADKIKCTAPVTPVEYNQIRNLLATASMADPETGLGLYIQFDRAGEVKTFPVFQVLGLPEMSEDLVSYPDFIEFELESRYIDENGLPVFTLYSLGYYGAGSYSF